MFSILEISKTLGSHFLVTSFARQIFRSDGLSSWIFYNRKYVPKSTFISLEKQHQYISNTNKTYACIFENGKPKSLSVKSKYSNLLVQSDDFGQNLSFRINNFVHSHSIRVFPHPGRETVHVWTNFGHILKQTGLTCLERVRTYPETNRPYMFGPTSDISWNK